MAAAAVLLLLHFALAACAWSQAPISISIATTLLASLIPLLWIAADTSLPSPRTILGVAIATHLIQWSAPPTLSDDLFRYLWDGRVQLAGINPFAHAPDAPELASLRDPIWESINHKSVPTIYPPLSQLLFRIVDALWHSPWAIKAIIGLFDLGIVGLLLASGGTRGRRAALLYGWCPLAAIESAGNGHIDAFAIFWMMVGVLALDGSIGSRSRAFRIAVGATAAAIAAKLLGVLLLPTLARRFGARAALWALALAALSYIPFAGARAGLLEGLSIYATTWSFNGGIHPLVAMAVGSIGARLLPIALIAGVAYLLYRRGTPPMVAVGALASILVLTSPVVHPWYILWLLPFAALHRTIWPFVLAGTVTISYEVLAGFRLDGAWEPAAWTPWAVYLPALATALWEGWTARGKGISNRSEVSPT